MARWQYTKGLHDIGNGLFAYLLPDGSWGWSNAGLVVDGEESLLIDTLFTVPLTAEMLTAMADATPAARTIDRLVNTHANVDHIWGNQLVKDAEIIVSTGCAEEFFDFPPERLHALMDDADNLGDLGAFLKHCFSDFDFGGIEVTGPTTTFADEMTLAVGDKTVHLYDVGPAHTRGDTLTYVPGDRAVFTGDIMFVGGHPVIWDGPIGNWQRACDRITAMEVDVVVPGHGPITDKAGVAEFKAYLDHIERETRARFDAGMDEWEASLDIPLADYDGWLDAERIYGNVAALYREFRGDTGHPDVMALFVKMAELFAVRQRAG